MKKNGFTLAEVLITLAIIGVVATLTLPALMSNTTEQQAKTALKKGLNTLTEAAQMNEAIATFHYGNLKSKDPNDDNEDTASMVSLLKNRTTMDRAKSGVDAAAAAGVQGYLDGNYTAFFRDGTAISFKLSDTTEKGYKDTALDGLSIGFPGMFDMNGVKNPNELSNCTGSGEATEETKGSICSDKKKRHIADQFSIRFRDNVVVPNGDAARWAMEN